MRRKGRTIGEIEVMELADAGVRTGATVVTEKVHKKRRRSNGDVEEGKVIPSTASYIQLRNRRILVDHHRHRDENQFLSSSSDHDDDVSCCSSNSGSSEKRIIELPDLEGESIEVEESTQFSSRERRETTPSREARAEKPENLDSTSSTPPEANSGRRSTVEKMPSEAEIEEFFAAAEKKLQKKFAENYNYDIVKDEPLEGRFEWVGLKP